MAIPAQSASPDADRIQIELLRAAGTIGRFARARSLSATTIALARQALRRRHPDLTEQEVLLRFAELHYGAELAAGLRRHLAARAR